MEIEIIRKTHKIIHIGEMRATGNNFNIQHYI